MSENESNTNLKVFQFQKSWHLQINLGRFTKLKINLQFRFQRYNFGMQRYKNKIEGYNFFCFSRRRGNQKGGNLWLVSSFGDVLSPRVYRSVFSSKIFSSSSTLISDTSGRLLL